MKNNYRNNKIRNLKLRKRLISLLVATSIGAGSYVLINSFHRKNNQVEYTTISETIDSKTREIPTTVIDTTPIPSIAPQFEVVNHIALEFNRSDSVITTSNVNLRINNNINSYMIGVLPQGTIVNRILSDGNWDLVCYNDTIAYVKSDYLQKLNVDYNNEYYKVEEYNDIVRTTTEVYFRLGPSKSEKEICLLDNNEELIVIGKAIINFNPADIWYIARTHGKIGFIKAEYTRSLRSALEKNVPTKDVKIQKLGYLISNTPIYDTNWNVSSYGDGYQLVQILQESNFYYLVNIDGKIGYIPKENVKEIKESFLVVDISNQIVSYYYNSDIVFQSVCTTGKKNEPTDIGFFEPYGKSSYHNFGPTHNNVEAKILWMPYNGGEGFHDASWEDNNNFGNYDYAMSHGSSGCVRLPDDAASFLYKNVPKSTKVLVKQ